MLDSLEKGLTLALYGSPDDVLRWAVDEDGMMHTAVYLSVVLAVLSTVKFVSRL